MVHPNHFRKIEKGGDEVPIFLLILTPPPQLQFWGKEVLPGTW